MFRAALFLSGESLPCGLPSDAEGRADLRPGNPTATKLLHPRPEVRLDLLSHDCHAGDMVEHLLVAHRLPDRQPNLIRLVPILVNDRVGQGDAFICDLHTRTANELFDFGVRLAAK